MERIKRYLPAQVTPESLEAAKFNPDAFEELKHLVDEFKAQNPAVKTITIGVLRPWSEPYMALPMDPPTWPEGLPQMFVHVGCMLARRAKPDQNGHAFEVFFCPSGFYSAGIRVLAARALWVFRADELCAEFAIVREKDIVATLHREP